MTYSNVIKAATGTALITLLQACGGGGGGSDSNEDNGQQAQPHVPRSTITFFASSLSVDHDCDPNQDNPGDFRIITKVTQDGELIAENSGAATLHADESKNMVSSTTIVADLEKVENKVVVITVDTSERDGGSRDGDSTLVINYEFQWNPYSLCWEDEYGYCLTTNDAINWRAWGSRHKLGREDEFNLFNPDDEGCEFTVSWNMALNDDGTY